MCCFNLTESQSQCSGKERRAVQSVSHFIWNSIFIHLPMRCAGRFFGLFLLLPFCFAFLLWPANYFCLLFTLCCCRSLSPPAFARGVAERRSGGLSALISRPSRRQYLLCTRRQSRQERRERQAMRDGERGETGFTKAGSRGKGQGARRGARQRPMGGKAARPAFLALDWRSRSLGIIAATVGQARRDVIKIQASSSKKFN